MGIFEIVTSILLFVCAIILIVIILSQEGKDAYLGGAIAGGAAETFLGKSKAHTMDTLLTRLTRVFAIALVVLTVIVNLAKVL